MKIPGRIRPWLAPVLITAAVWLLWLPFLAGGSIRFDNDLMISRPDTALSRYISEGRPGLVVLLHVLGLTAFNPLKSALLFLVFFGTSKAFGWNLSGELSAIIVFSFWGTAEMGDLVRGAVMSIPVHQYESAAALGLTGIQTYRYIVLPQTVRRLIPLSINLITRMIKTTSLVLMIGVVEVLKVAQQIIEANRMSSPNAAFGVYLTVFLMYFAACWPISMLARYLEKQWR